MYRLKDINEIVIAPTLDCNFKCKYCPVYNEILNKTIIDWQLDLEKMFDFFNQNKTKLVNLSSIGFFGGEPLLKFPELKKMIEFFKSYQKGLLFFLDTNCSLLTQEIFSYLKANQVYIKMSIDGDEKTHNANRMSYKKLQENLQGFKDYPKIVASMVVTPITAKDLTDNILHLKSLGLRNFEIYPQFNVNWSEAEVKNLDNNLHQAIVTLEQQIKDNTINFSRGSHFSRKKLKEIWQNCRCGTWGKRILILPDNNFYTCIGTLCLKKKYWPFFNIGGLKSGLKQNINFARFFKKMSTLIKNSDEYLPPCAYFGDWQKETDLSLKKKTFSNLVRVMEKFYSELFALNNSFNFFDFK
jgi:uncharacterized protein